jgi:hypothetical protein
LIGSNNPDSQPLPISAAFKDDGIPFGVPSLAEEASKLSIISLVTVNSFKETVVAGITNQILLDVGAKNWHVSIIAANVFLSQAEPDFSAPI